jgi:hypothetical protein
MLNLYRQSNNRLGAIITLSSAERKKGVENTLSINSSRLKFPIDDYGKNND